VCGSQTPRQLLVICIQFPEHFLWTNHLFIVVFQPLIFRDVSDRADRGAADLTCSLSDFIRHREKLRALFVWQQMIIAKVLAAHVPMKILWLHVKREHVGEQSTQVA